MQAMRGSQKSLILVARQLGVHIGPNDIPERFKNDERELSPKEMCELQILLISKLNQQK